MLYPATGASAKNIGESAILSQHVIADFYETKNLTDIEPIEQALLAAAKKAGATVLNIKLHDFGTHKGVTGVTLLAESHISIHTWPEFDYAAIDIFMCGDAESQIALECLRDYFKPKREDVKVLRRGQAIFAENAPLIAAGIRG